MRVTIISVFLLTAALCLPATAACIEKDIPLSEVPAHVMTAASAAVERIVIIEAERIVEDDAVIYELEGAAGGIDYEIHVSPSGEVLGIEEDDD